MAGDGEVAEIGVCGGADWSECRRDGCCRGGRGIVASTVWRRSGTGDDTDPREAGRSRG